MSTEILESNPFATTQTTSTSSVGTSTTRITQEIEKYSHEYAKAKEVVDKLREKIGEKVIEELGEDLIKTLKEDTSLLDTVSKVTKVLSDLKQVSESLDKLTAIEQVPEIKKILELDLDPSSKLIREIVKYKMLLSLIDYLTKSSDSITTTQSIRNEIKDLREEIKKLTNNFGDGRGSLTQLKQIVELIKEIKNLSREIEEVLGRNESEVKKNPFNFDKINDKELEEAAKRYLRSLGYDVVPADPDKAREYLRKYIDLSKEVEIEKMRMACELAQQCINVFGPEIIKAIRSMFVNPKKQAKEIKTKLRNLLNKR